MSDFLRVADTIKLGILMPRHVYVIVLQGVKISIANHFVSYDMGNEICSFYYKG